MKIPKRFKLFGQTIEVEFDSDLAFKDDDVGQACYRENKIKLQEPEKDRPLEQIESIFWHEVVHFICFVLGYHDQRTDEAFVNRFGNAIHQIISTMEYK